MFMRTLASTALLAVALVSNAHASIVTYATRTAFNTANPTATTEGFEGITTPTSQGIGNVTYNSGFSRGALKITDAGIAGAVLNVLDTSYQNNSYNVRNRFGAAAGSVIDANYGDLTLTFGGAVTSFAIDLGNLVPRNGFAGSVASNIFTFVADGVTLGTYNFSGTGFGFYGFTSNIAFSSLTILNGQHTNDDLFDNVSYVLAPAAVSVPEPGSIALLGLGVVAVAIVRRRKPV